MNAAYIKGVMFNPVGRINENLYSSGEIQGFSQSAGGCLVLCGNIQWNYQDFSVDIGIAPAVGVSWSPAEVSFSGRDIYEVLQ